MDCSRFLLHSIYAPGHGRQLHRYMHYVPHECNCQDAEVQGTYLAQIREQPNDNVLLSYWLTNVAILLFILQQSIKLPGRAHPAAGKVLLSHILCCLADVLAGLGQVSSVSCVDTGSGRHASAAVHEPAG